MMKFSVKSLLVATSVSALVACGGGGGGDGDTGPVPVNLKLSGTVDGIGGAAVNVQMGDTVVASGVSDANGKFSVNLPVMDEDHTKQVVVKARRISDKVAYTSLVGTVGNVVSEAAGPKNEVNASTLNELNVTNVTTAVYALLDDLDNDLTKTPSQLSDDEVTQLKAQIKAAANLQAKVVDAAAAILAVVDYGATLNYDGSGIADTEALAAAIVKKTDSQAELDLVSATTALVTSAELESEVTTDATLASQLIVPALVPSDLVGNSYFSGHNVIFRFVSYDIAAGSGVAQLGDYDAITGVDSESFNGTSFGASTAMPDQTWTMSGDQISISGFDEDGAPHSVDISLHGGTVDAMPITATFNSTNTATTNLIRMRDANSLLQVGTQNLDFTLVPAVSFDLEGGEIAQMPMACDDFASGQMSLDGSMMMVTCTISASGEFLFQIDSAYTGGVTWPPVLVAPLVDGSIGQMALLPDFSQEISVVEMSAPVAMLPMVPGTCTDLSLCGKFRIDDDGLVSMSFADHLNQLTNLFMEISSGVYTGKNKVLSDVADPVLGTGLNVRGSINTDFTTGQSYLFKLPGDNSDLSYRAVVIPGSPSTVKTRSEYKLTGYNSDGSDLAGKTVTVVDDEGTVTHTYGAINTTAGSPTEGYGSLTITGPSVNLSGLWKIDTSIVLDGGTSPLVHASAADVLAGSGDVYWTYRSTLKLNAAGTSYHRFTKILNNSGPTIVVKDIYRGVVTAVQ